MSICDHCRMNNRVGARMCASCGKLLSGTTLQNRFEIIRLIKASMMSSVYLARARHFAGDLCVIKEMSDRFATPQERQMALQMISQEALMLRRLNHPLIPRVLDYFEENHRHYIAMDYVQGSNLYEVLQQEGRPGLPEKRVLGWAEQLCDVLEYLHSQTPPVIFRDLKPSNIMLTSGECIKLIDFGISRFFNPSRSHDTWNMGTIGYAPPEQFGQGQTDARSDIYALGASLHQLLTGRDPTISPFIFPPLRALIPSLSPNIEAIVGKALAIEANGRYTSARMMQDALRNANGLFDVAVDFVRPQLYMHEDPVCQFMLSITSKEGLNVNVGQVTVHICLVLDVSGSMFVDGNYKSVEDQKYQPLLKAIRHLIAKLPDHYLLTIVVFSTESDMICAMEPVLKCQQTTSDLLERIDHSPVKGNQTNLAPALSMVWDQVKMLHKPGVVNRLCILTDGQIQDGDNCKPIFDEIRNSSTEAYAYGFGSDWEKEPLWSMLSGFKGGAFKPVGVSGDGNVTTYDIESTFERFAMAGRNIVAAEAELEVALSHDVIPKDAFRYEPIVRHIGHNFCDANNVFRTSIGSLERDTSYAYCFEARLQATQMGAHEIGMVSLQYTVQGRPIIQRYPVIVQRTPDKRAADQNIAPAIQEAFLILEGLRSTNSRDQLRALQARLNLLLNAGGQPDQRQIKALQTAIQHLQQYGSLDQLSQEDQVWIQTDSRGSTLKIIR